MHGLEWAINEAGFEPSGPLTKSLIGPPLKDTLGKILNGVSNEQLDSIVNTFKIFYDSEGYKKSIAYEGIDDFLKNLKAASITLYLATNKRLVPTQKIIQYFGWQNIFAQVYAIDKYGDSPFANKAEMIGSLLRNESIRISDSLYIGDRIEDKVAAEKNNLSTILVGWGYEDFGAFQTMSLRPAESPSQLQAMILNHP